MKKFILILSLVLLVGCQNTSNANTEDINNATVSSENIEDVEESSSQDAFVLWLDGVELLTGDPLTNDYFKQKPYTLVNVWGTFCPPCIEEMPELNEIHNKNQDVQVLGIVADTSTESETNLDTAKSLVSDNKLDYLNLVPSSNFYKSTLSNIQGLPTSFIVDQNGKVISQLFVGAGTADEYLEFIDFTMEYEN